MRSRIERSGGDFFLRVNGNAVPLYGYMTYQPKKGMYEQFSSAPLAFVRVMLGDQGINQISAIRADGPGFWRGIGRYDFSDVARDFERAAAGGAYLAPRVMTEPPAWWEELHPEELCLSFQGEPAHASVCSKAYLRDVKDALFAFQDWLSESGWSERVVMWHLAGGNTEEFLRPTIRPMFYTDYSKPALDAWRARRGADEAPPSSMERRYACLGDRRDPEKEEKTIDYARFLSETNVSYIESLCRAAKEATGGSVPVGAFYGYLVNVPDPEIGHHAVTKMLESKDVDFLASPFSYTDLRAPGTDWPIPGAVASARLHGKPWLMEMDVRTHLSKPISVCYPELNPKVNDAYDAPVWYGPKTAALSLGQMKKAFLSALTHGCGGWWFDMWGGWYDDPAYLALINRASEIVKGFRYESRAETAVFLDETLPARVTVESGIAFRAAHGLLQNLGFSGAPYDVYVRADWERVRDRYKLSIFPCQLPPEDAAGMVVSTGRVSEDRLDRDRRVMWFSALAPEPNALREVALAAGAHAYCFTNDVAYAAGDLVALHAASEGVKRLYLPRKGRLIDVETGEDVSVAYTFGEFRMAFGETRIFRVQ